MKIAVIQKVRRPSFKRVNQSRWVLYAGNFNQLCDSGETYANLADCKHGLAESLGPVSARHEPLGASKMYRKVRGLRPANFVGAIVRETDIVYVYDEVRK